jgi:hypothetical protein
MPNRGYGGQVPSPGPLAAGGHVMADPVRVTSMPTPVTHPEHVQSALTWINLALGVNGSPRQTRILRGREPTRVLGMAAASLGEPVEEVLQGTPHGRSGDSR